MPSDVPRLVGRVRELDALRDALAPGSTVRVSGPPGIGKTALLEAALDVEQTLWLADVDGAEEARVAHALLEQVGRSPPTELDAPLILEAHLPALTAVVVGRRGGATEAELDALRERLWSYNDRLVWIEHCDVARPGAVDTVIELGPLDADGSAVELLERALDERGGSPTADRAMLRRLAALLDGNPLALLRAAERLAEAGDEELDVATVARVVQEGPSLAERWERAWERLSETERDVLVAIRAMGGGATRGDVALCAPGDADAWEALSSLARGGWLRRAGHRWTLPRLTASHLARRAEADRARWGAVQTRALSRAATECRRLPPSLFPLSHAAIRAATQDARTGLLAGGAIFAAERLAPAAIERALTEVAGAIEDRDPRACVILSALALAPRARLRGEPAPAPELERLEKLAARLDAPYAGAASQLVTLCCAEEPKTEDLVASVRALARAAARGETTALFLQAHLMWLSEHYANGEAATQESLHEALFEVGDATTGARFLLRAAVELLDRDDVERAVALLDALPRYAPSREPGRYDDYAAALLALRQGRYVDARAIFEESARAHAEARRWLPSFHVTGCAALAAFGEAEDVAAATLALAPLDDVIDAYARTRIMSYASMWRSHRIALRAAAGLSAHPDDPRDPPTPPDAPSVLESRLHDLAVLAHDCITRGAEEAVAATEGRSAANGDLAQLLALVRHGGALRAREEAPTPIRVAPDLRWVDDGSARHSLDRRALLRRLLGALLDAGEGGLTHAELLEAGWPGERILEGAAENRLRVAVTRLRGLGVGAALETLPGGYRVDPSQVTVIAPGDG